MGEYTFIFFLLLLLFHLFLYFACSFPSEKIYENVSRSAEILLKEAPVVQIGLLEKNDSYTDALILNEAYSIDNQKPFTSYMYARKNYKNGVTKCLLKDQEEVLLSYAENSYDDAGAPVPDEDYNSCQELVNFLSGEVTTSVSYTRYYHGYLAVFRVLLLFFDLKGIRIFQFFLYLFLFFMFCYLLKKKIGTATMIVFLFSFLVYGYFYVSYSLQLSMLFIVVMVSSIFLLKNIDTYTDSKFSKHLFITGAISNYVDFLTTPILSLAIPLLIYVLYQRRVLKRESSSRQDIFQILACCLFWGIGYALTWISKWLLFAWIFENGNLLATLSQIGYRTLGEMSRVTTYFLPSMTIFFTTLLFGITLFTIPLVASPKISWKPFHWKEWKENISLLLIGLLPIAWCTVLLNHSILHILFTYRNMLPVLIVILLLLLEHVEIKRRKAEKKT